MLQTGRVVLMPDWLITGTLHSFSVSTLTGSQAERRMAGKRVLLVEDEEEIAEILALMLRGEGYVVDTAGTLEQARQRLRSVRYALVNTDLRLPDGDGLEIADCAADLGARTSILSGYVLQLSSAAADRHEVLMKPMRPSEFVAAVHRLIGPAQET
jgi:DNA-binding response OmpR family regulator